MCFFSKPYRAGGECLPNGAFRKKFQIFVGQVKIILSRKW